MVQSVLYLLQSDSVLRIPDLEEEISANKEMTQLKRFPLSETEVSREPI
jgi:hypothetical protein